MVLLIKTIDAIARERNEDVIFLSILAPDGSPTRHHPALKEATEWLSCEGIGWALCGAFQPDWISLGAGPHAIFIDAPYRPGSDLLARLDAQFEKEDGTPRIPGLVLTLLTLEEAMVNAAQDDPDFWDRF